MSATSPEDVIANEISPVEDGCARGWGPEHKSAALSLTFDNFGEAAELESGSWGDRPIGQHYTANFVPRLLAALGGIRATYFVEGSNAALYPTQLQSWQSAGHEIGLHGWRHERWESCPAERRRRLIDDSLTAMRAIGLDPVGFRPPGGAVPSDCYAELEQAGFLYCSDLGSPGVGRVGDLIRIPFEWRGVDSFLVEHVLAPVRVAHGLAPEALELDSWRDELDRALRETIASRGHRTIVFHPMFLARSDDKLRVVENLIEKARKADLWIAPLGDVARFTAAAMASAVPQMA